MPKDQGISPVIFQINAADLIILDIIGDFLNKTIGRGKHRLIIGVVVFTEGSVTGIS